MNCSNSVKAFQKRYPEITSFRMEIWINKEECPFVESFVSWDDADTRSQEIMSGLSKRYPEIKARIFPQRG